MMVGDNCGITKKKSGGILCEIFTQCEQANFLPKGGGQLHVWQVFENLQKKTDTHYCTCSPSEKIPTLFFAAHITQKKSTGRLSAYVCLSLDPIIKVWPNLLQTLAMFLFRRLERILAILIFIILLLMWVSQAKFLFKREQSQCDVSLK